VVELEEVDVVDNVVVLERPESWLPPWTVGWTSVDEPKPGYGQRDLPLLAFRIVPQEHGRRGAPIWDDKWR
jgi:hypothetical protein